MAIFTSHKVDFKTKSIIRHFITTKVSVNKENIILNACASNNRASKYTYKKITDLKGETHKPTQLENLTPLDSSGRRKQSFKEDTEDLNSTAKEFDLTDIYRTRHPIVQNTHSF